MRCSYLTGIIWFAYLYIACFPDEQVRRCILYVTNIFKDSISKPFFPLESNA